MIEVANIRNGVVLFSIEDKVRVFILSNKDQDIFIDFDSSEYDKTRLSDTWLVKDVTISRQKNKEICAILDNLYDSYFEFFSNNKQTFINNNVKDYGKYFYRYHGDYALELKYPSDATCLERAPQVGITKQGNEGYLFTFHRSINNRDEKFIWIRKEDSRIPELFSLYNENINALINLDSNDYNEINRKFTEVIKENNTNSIQKILKL